MTAAPAHDMRNTPQLAGGHFICDTRYMPVGNIPTGTLAQLNVPKGMAKRRIYAAIMHSSFSQLPAGPSFTGELIFRLDGNIVYRVAFDREQTGMLRLRPGMEAHSVTGGLMAYPGFQKPPKDSLAVCIDHAEHIIPPLHLTLTCDSIQLLSFRLYTEELDLGAVLACHSEGFCE